MKQQNDATNIYISIESAGILKCPNVSPKISYM